MSKERLSLYFDTDIPIEKHMWDYICKDGKNRKSYNVKKALEMIIEGVEFKPVVVEQAKDENKTTKNTEPDVIETNEEDDLEGEDLPF